MHRRNSLTILIAVVSCVAVSAACGGGSRTADPKSQARNGGGSTQVAPLPELGNIVVESNVAVPMRDGVVLRADVYRPAGEGRWPVLIMRTPYGKDGAVSDGSEPTILRGARSGYAVVVQDVRGRYHSDGEFNPYRNEGKDGYDTIEWAAGQPWSNGKVGTFGLSYPGAVQWLAAMEAPPPDVATAASEAAGPGPAAERSARQAVAHPSAGIRARVPATRRRRMRRILPAHRLTPVDQGRAAA